MADDELTERERYWFDHLKAAQERNITLVGYAAEQGLKVKELYNRKSRFIKKGLMRSSVVAKDFISVGTQVPSQCRVLLANGVRVEFDSPLTDRAIREILINASRLP
jgi:hypothetical protein